MPYNSHKHHRRSLRLPGYDYAQAGAYFVTLCTYDRECLFGDIVDGETRLNEYGEVIATCWHWLSTQYPQVELDVWVVMPNHFHGILVLTDDRRDGSPTAPTPSRKKPLGRLIGAFKTIATKRINEIRAMPGVLLWQRNYYEHVIRNENDLHDIRHYIVNNPLRWMEDENNPVNLQRGAIHESPLHKERLLRSKRNGSLRKKL